MQDRDGVAREGEAHTLICKPESGERTIETGPRALCFEPAASNGCRSGDCEAAIHPSRCFDGFAIHAHAAVHDETAGGLQSRPVDARQVG